MKITKKDIGHAVSLIMEAVAQKDIDAKALELKSSITGLSTAQANILAKDELENNLKVKSKPSPGKEPEKNAMISSIQKMIGTPDDQVDGKWSQKTSDSWVAWISSEKTMKRISNLAAKREVILKESNGMTKLEIRSILESFLPRLSEEPEEKTPEEETPADISDELKAYIDKNKGSAATIAKDLKYKGSLSGVYNMLQDLEKLSTDGAIEETEKAGFVPVTYEDLKKRIKIGPKDSITTSATFTLSSIPITYIKSADGSDNKINVTGSGTRDGSHRYKSVTDFIKDGTGTSEYFDRDGRINNSNFDFVISGGSSKTEFIDDVGYELFNLYIDGTLNYNASIKNYTAVKQRKTKEVYIVPVADIKSGKELKLVSESILDATKITKRQLRRLILEEVRIKPYWR